MKHTLILLLALLVAPLATLHAAELSVPLDAPSWISYAASVPEARRPTASEVRKEEGIRFSLAGEVAQSKLMRWERPWTEGELGTEQFIVLEYRAWWLAQQRPYTDVIALYSSDAEGKNSLTSLVTTPDLICDGQWHRVLLKRPYPLKPTALRVVLESPNSEAWLEVRRLEWISSLEKTGAALPEDKEPAAQPNFEALPLQFNDRFDSLMKRLLTERPNDPAVHDGGTWFAKEDVSVAGIPFRVGAKPEANNLILPPPEPKENQEIIEHFGIKAPRRAVAKVSRDSLITVPVDREVSEVLFLLAAESHSRELDYFIGHSPTTMETVEEFAVELVYESGMRDWAFPYSVLDGHHLIRRALGVYAVAATGAKLKEVVLHNRKFSAQVLLAAITVNTGKDRRFPALAHEPQRQLTKAKMLDGSISPFAQREGDLLKLGNAHYELSLDAGRLLTPVAMIHRRLNKGAARVNASPLLEMKVAGKAIPAQQWKLDSVEELPLGFVVSYTSSDESLPLRCAVTVQVDESPETSFQLAVQHVGGASVNADVHFPVLHGLQLGAADDLQCFFPQYRNALGGDRATYYAYAGLSFPMQFFDVFDERSGGGVWLRTEDQAGTDRNYFLSKQADGAHLYVEYPGHITQFALSARTEFPVTRLGFHAGDWRASVQRYSDWLSTWYQPLKSQDKTWLRESFWLLAEITDDVPAAYYKLPAWYDQEKKRILFRDILSEWERKAGYKPDILHLWGWAYDPKTIIRWGEYGGRDYDGVGGQPAFKDAIADVQNNLGIPISLYINATLCCKDTPAGQRLPGSAMQLANGSPSIPYRDTYRMCLGSAFWTDHLVDTYQRVVRETGAKILYVDELAMRQNLLSKGGGRCFNPDHGHPVPSHVNELDHRFLHKLRSAVPGEVALYGEYPCTYAASQMLDGVIHYYFHRGAGPLFSPVFDAESSKGTDEVAMNLYRFLFPKMWHLDLPMSIAYSSWHPLKFTFFNGEAIYDSFWNIDESRGHAFITRAYELKKRFKDCFTSDVPEMLVPTERSSVYANRFPGKDRTVWTIYNARPNTTRGEVLAVPHREGCDLPR
ncbi:MAG: DUF6259 domain-containing protein [Verrucomicrobiota bacterium]